ncbi:MAG: hypothetical protein J6C93_02805 [Clostridia bacterium]|nr:hypothetical protein [Clostridia bacterium]
MKRLLELNLTLQNELMTTVRLTTGGVCSCFGLTLDESEDCKLCVTEALLLLTRNGFQTARVVFCEEEGLQVILKGELREGARENSVEEDISCALLEALVENLSIERDGEGVCAVSFRFGS